MSAVKLVGKMVEIPDEMIEQYKSGALSKNGLIDYAVTTQQGKPSDFGLEDAPKPDVSGAMQAAMIGAGRQVKNFESNFQQLMAEYGPGYGGAANRQMASDLFKRQQAEIDRLAKPVKQEYPKSSFAGEMLPSFAVPGGKAAQITAGGVMGALQGDTTAERIGLGALGAGMSYAGQKAGEAISNRVVPAIQSALGSSLGSARQTLTQSGVPLTFGQRGSPIGKFVDVLKSTLLRRQPLEGAQLTAMNKLAAEAIGENADDLSKPVLNAAWSRIGQVYEDVAEKVGTIAIGADDAARLAQIDDMMRVVPEPSKVRGAINLVEDLLTDPNKNFTGAAYNAVRQRLGRISGQLWNSGSGLEAEVVDEMIDTLDDALARSAPEAGEALSKVRPQWKFLIALRRGGAVNDAGNINPRAMAQAMERVYKGFDVGVIPEGAAGRFGQTLDAFNQVVKPFKSSGTAERVSTVALPLLAGLGLTTMGGPVVGGGLALATLLSGGGAGAAAGGNISREAALRLAEALRQRQAQ